MSKNFDRKVILLKQETTEGTDSAPVVGTDALRVLNYQPTFMTADGRVRNIEKEYFGADPVSLANFRRGASFDLELHGSGSAGTAPQWMKALPYAGFADPALVASTSATQDPNSSVVSATHYGYIDDLLLKTIGARGNVGYTIEAGQVPVLNYTLLGRPPSTLAEESAPGSATISGVTDPVIANTDNTTFTLDGFSLPLRRMALNANADLQFRSLIGPQDRVTYRNRSLSGQIVAEVPDLTAKDYFSKIRPGTTMASSCVHGTVAGNIVTITHPALQITGDVGLSEEQGVLMMTLPVTALPVSGNDEIRFVAT